MRLTRSLLAASWPVIAVLAQAQDAPPRGLRPLEAVRIQETDTLFLARPSHMVLGSQGHVYVTEAGSASIRDIGPSGRIEHTFGRSGRGPGEFVSPTTMATSGDTLLAVYDHATKRVTLIDVPRWTLIRVVPLVAQWPPVIRFAGNELLATSWDFTSRTSLARVNEGTGSLDERQGVIPDLGPETQILITGAFWSSTFVPIGDEVFALYEVSNSLFRWRRGAREAREIALPVVRRRGIPPGWFESVLRDPGSATPARIFDRSGPVAIAQVAGDILAIVMMDVKVEGGQWSAVHHVTLYDSRREQVCADLPVPASRTKVALARDPLPVVALRGDTLALLELAEEAAGDPVQLLRRYRIEPTECDWRPIAR